MPKKAIEELRQMAVPELKSEILDLRAKLFALRSEASLKKKVEKPHEFTRLRRRIAQAMTIIGEQQ